MGKAAFSILISQAPDKIIVSPAAGITLHLYSDVLPNTIVLPIYLYQKRLNRAKVFASSKESRLSRPPFDNSHCRDRILILLMEYVPRWKI
jgi:hypothetical protein